MNNPQTYLNHSLNNSSTKQTFSFSKSQRFPVARRLKNNHNFYNLPSTIGRRSCSFGFGNKISLENRSNSPPPGSYEQLSDFKKSQKYNTISISVGRDKVKFGSFLGNSDRLKSNPSPNAYRIRTQYSKVGGRMAAKLPSQIDLRSRKRVPGPGTYELDISQMKKSGSYILSNYKNNISPVYQSPSNRQKTFSPEKLLGPGQYQTSNQKFGQSLLSKFKNSVSGSFTKQKRPGMADKSKKGFPGFKYRRFSQFGTIQN